MQPYPSPGVRGARQDKESVARLGAGAEASSSFPPLEAALFRPWKGLHPRRTHKLFFVLRSALLP